MQMRFRSMWRWGAGLVLLLAIAVVGCDGTDERVLREETPAKSRIVAIGGTITEMVYALGAGDRLVGVDVTSLYPEAATKLPQVGYQRTISAENVLSLAPTMILASAEAGPPAAIEQLKGSGVRVVILPTADHSVEGVKRTIGEVARALELPERGAQLIDSVDRETERTRSLLASAGSKPKVMFIYTRGQGSPQVSGRGSAADAMITLAGGVNAVVGYDGYKPLTAEAAVEANPDVILLPNRALEMMGGIDGLLRQPGLAGTNAGRTRRIVAMDDLLLLGFGPRLPQATRELARAIHPELAEKR